MIKLQRPEKRGDRSRKRENAHTESPVKVFVDGMVQVEVSRPATASRLQRMGWQVVTEAKPAAPDTASAKPKRKRKAKAKAKATS
jgi:hypothetical protein